MKKPGLILLGAGGHANSCIDVIEQEGKFEIVGLLGLPEQQNTICLGYPVIGTDIDLSILAQVHQYALIGVGQIKIKDHRIRLYKQVIQFGLQLPTIVAPSAYVSRFATLGVGNIVMHGAIIGPRANVGNNCIINNNALLEHDVTIADHCHVSTGAILNGNVKVGEGSFIGSGSVIREGVTIGSGCVVGMGLTVRHSLNDNCHFIG